MQKQVALVIGQGVQALDVAGPLDVFSEANTLLPVGEGYCCAVLAASRDPVRSSNGMAILPHFDLSEAERRFDLVLVAGGPSMPVDPADRLLSGWLRSWGARASRYGSVCTGAFALGHAGLLDGRSVTTHWQHAGELADRFPAAHVEPDRIYIRDGRLVTSAGVTAGIDLALALVGEDHGETLALACAKRLVVVTRRQGGQSQFSPLLTLAGKPDTAIGRVQSYVMEHLDEAFTVERLAQIGGTSARTIARLFVQELGTTPHEFVENVRIDQARSLLEAGDLPVKAVSFACGFATPEQMRTAFQRRLGISPLRYRESFNRSAA